MGATYRPQTIALECPKILPSFTAYNKHSLADISHIAWALLLRCYTQQDAVSFVAPSGNFTNITHGDSEAFKKGPRSTDTLIRYHLPPNLHISQVQPVATESCVLEEIVHRGQVNTAVIYSASLCNGHGDEAVKLAGFPEREHGSLFRALDLILEASWPSFHTILHYRPSAISREYAKSIAKTFTKIITSLMLEQKLTISDINWLSSHNEERLVSWNPNDPFRAEQRDCMHHLFERKACKLAARPAICAWNGNVTYSELDSLASTAAKRLQRLGVRPGVYVPFAYEKSMWTVVAMLAILKAGGAFVPLNPGDPPVRLAEIVGNVKASVVITMQSLAHLFMGMVEYVEIISEETVGLEKSDHDWDESTLSVEDPSVQRDSVCPGDPIFVLFTSGSTGKPKGMIHSHAAICTHTMAHGTAMGYHQARVLQFAAHTFDVAIIDVFTTLIFGGCICIPSEEDRKSDIVGFINRTEVDFAILTPSFAGLIDPCDVPTLRTVAIGGEALPQDRIEKWSNKTRLLQIYGPAEVGICIVNEMRPTTPPENVGFTLPNCACWLVDPDDSDSLVPIGAVGELVVAGPSLTLGYLNDDYRTAASFLHRPSWATRLGLQYHHFYKSGDLLRKDSQIKLRGQRIEPGEVEYHLGRLPGIAVSMVTLPKDGCYAGEVVAVVQMQGINGERSRIKNDAIRLASKQTLTLAMVRDTLNKLLPSYMVPSVCLVIDSMPFVPSMKIDRKAVANWLTTLDARQPGDSSFYISPLDPGEVTAQSLSAKIAESLTSGSDSGRSTLRDQDFKLADIGINSIQTISLSMYIQNQFATKVPMNILLDPDITIRGVADFVDCQTRPSGPENKIPVPAMRDPTLEIETLANSYLQGFSFARPCTQHKTSFQNVLLTGATGFLGISILHHLLLTPDLHVHALVRCSSPTVGLQRLIAAATKYGYWNDSYLSRLHIWPGDLSLPNIGLSSTHLNQLSPNLITPPNGHTNGIKEASTTGAQPGTISAPPSSTPTRDPIPTEPTSSHPKSPSSNHITAIIHAGARVHYSSSYATLKPINVLSTAFLLRAASTSPHLHSFIFVAGGEMPDVPFPSLTPRSSSHHDDNAGAAQIKDDVEYIRHLEEQASGYTQSKFVAEGLVRRAVHLQSQTPTRPINDHTSITERDKTIHIIKPGYIIGSIPSPSILLSPPAHPEPHSGPRSIANHTDYLWRLIASCVAIGAYNGDEADCGVYISDAGTVARVAIKPLLFDDSCDTSTTHNEAKTTTRILSSLPLSHIISLVTAVTGTTLFPLPQLRFLEKLK
ncbi:MAG: hypothetical protein Q9174_001401, partial [Haloplaca sp. 1 TL-2023]